CRRAAPGDMQFAHGLLQRRRYYLAVPAKARRSRGRFADLPRRLYETAQHLGNAPGLCDAAARRKGLVGVEDLADRADRGFAEMRLEPRQEASRARLVVGMRPDPGVDERAD